MSSIEQRLRILENDVFTLKQIICDYDKQNKSKYNKVQNVQNVQSVQRVSSTRVVAPKQKTTREEKVERRQQMKKRNTAQKKLTVEFSHTTTTHDYLEYNEYYKAYVEWFKERSGPTAEKAGVTINLNPLPHRKFLNFLKRRVYNPKSQLAKAEVKNAVWNSEHPAPVLTWRVDQLVDSVV